MAGGGRTGFLVVFEGIDGAGKTTQANLLAKVLSDCDVSVLQTKEPTAGRYGNQLRLSASSGRLPPEEELDLFLQDREEHVRLVIGPGLQAGKVVIVDRYYLSTAAYQGARGLDPEEILSRNEGFAPIPDAAVLLRIDVSTGRSRIRERGDGRGNLFEKKSELERVARVFDRLNRDYIIRIDGRPGVNQVFDSILSSLKKLPRLKDLLDESLFKRKS